MPHERSTGFFIAKKYFFDLLSIMVFGKNANSIYIGMSKIRTAYKTCLATVGVCVFRALTSVGALFYFTEVHMEQTKEEILNNLYALRAGSVISQEKDKADALNNQANEKIENWVSSLNGRLPNMSNISPEYNEHITGRATYIPGEIKSGELNARKAEKLKEQAQKKAQSSLIINSVFLVVCLSLIAVFAILGVRNLLKSNENYTVFFTPAGVLAIITLYFHWVSSLGLKHSINLKKQTKTDIEKLDNYAQAYLRYDAEKNDLLKATRLSVNEIVISSQKLYNALLSEFNPLLDARDWQHLDLVIFYLETYRADTIKEALQLLERELQTRRIEDVIIEATKAICSTLAAGFNMLNNTMITCCNRLSAQISQSTAAISTKLSNLTSAVNMSNALQVKSNVTSEHLMRDVSYIRNALN